MIAKIWSKFNWKLKLYYISKSLIWEDRKIYSSFKKFLNLIFLRKYCGSFLNKMIRLIFKFHVVQWCLTFKFRIFRNRKKFSISRQLMMEECLKVLPFAWTKSKRFCKSHTLAYFLENEERRRDAPEGGIEFFLRPKLVFEYDWWSLKLLGMSVYSPENAYSTDMVYRGINLDGGNSTKNKLFHLLPAISTTALQKSFSCDWRPLDIYWVEKGIDRIKYLHRVLLRIKRFLPSS